jgi:hypothetical protein
MIYRNAKPSAQNGSITSVDFAYFRLKGFFASFDLKNKLIGCPAGKCELTG